MLDLYNIGLSDKEIKEIIENGEVNINDKNSMVLFNILKEIGCNNRIMRNILISNPYYLNRDVDSIRNLIKKLKLIGINNLDITFDSNPYLLNKNDFEIDEYIESKLNDGMDLDDIVDDISAGITF